MIKTPSNGSLLCYQTHIVCALADGAEIRSKGPGHNLKKLVSRILDEKMENRYSRSLQELVDASLKCLRNVGYDWSDSADRIRSILSEEEAAYLLALERTGRFLERQVQLHKEGNRADFTINEIAHWWSSRGIHPDRAKKFLAAGGVNILDCEQDKPSERFYILKGYSFDTNDRVDDPKAWLQDAEAKYFATGRRLSKGYFDYSQPQGTIDELCQPADAPRNRDGFNR